ncbi:MAG: hypothetical protein RLZZ623_3291 [Actinomycetota bacterium]|jgi:microsomal epoxide hydrolase
MHTDHLEDFRVAIEPTAVVDLRRRLAATRWPDQLDGTGWQLGTDRAELRQLCDHWAGAFDFGAFERRCNVYPQVRTVIDGVVVHAIVARSGVADATPLLLVHGWPGSVAEHFDVIEPLLAHHHVIVASLPGYGFSGPTTQHGIGVAKIAELLVELMRRLGHPVFFLAGGDWGAIIGARLAADHPTRVLGAHLTMLPVPRPSGSVKATVTDDEADLRDRARAVMASGTGYQAIQSTRPQTLAYGLTDSPAGLAGWILEKFHAWSDCAGDLACVFTPDRLLENISIYWFTGTINSSMRLYHEGMVNDVTTPHGVVTVPTGHAVFPGEIYHTPRAWAEERYRIVHWTRQPRGGHFAAMEVPLLYAADVLAFTGTVTGG